MLRSGNLKILAEALEKSDLNGCNFKIYLLTRFKVIRWDPHPPVYFRIRRLETLKKPEEIKHTLIQSIKDNITTFVDAIRTLCVYIRVKILKWVQNSFSLIPSGNYTTICLLDDIYIAYIKI